MAQMINPCNIIESFFGGNPSEAQRLYVYRVNNITTKDQFIQSYHNNNLNLSLVKFKETNDGEIRERNYAMGAFTDPSMTSQLKNSSISDSERLIKISTIVNLSFCSNDNFDFLINSGDTDIYFFCLNEEFVDQETTPLYFLSNGSTKVAQSSDLLDPNGDQWLTVKENEPMFVLFLSEVSTLEIGQDTKLNFSVENFTNEDYLNKKVKITVPINTGIQNIKIYGDLEKKENSSFFKNTKINFDLKKYDSTTDTSNFTFLFPMFMNPYDTNSELKLSNFNFDYLNVFQKNNLMEIPNITYWGYTNIQNIPSLKNKIPKVYKNSSEPILYLNDQQTALENLFPTNSVDPRAGDCLFTMIVLLYAKFVWKSNFAGFNDSVKQKYGSISLEDFSNSVIDSQLNKFPDLITSPSWILVKKYLLCLSEWVKCKLAFQNGLTTDHKKYLYFYFDFVSNFTETPSHPDDFFKSVPNLNTFKIKLNSNWFHITFQKSSSGANTESFLYPKCESINESYSRYVGDDVFVAPTLPIKLSGDVNIPNSLTKLQQDNNEIYKYLVFYPTNNIQEFNNLFKIGTSTVEIETTVIVNSLWEKNDPNHRYATDEEILKNGFPFAASDKIIISKEILTVEDYKKYLPCNKDEYCDFLKEDEFNCYYKCTWDIIKKPKQYILLDNYPTKVNIKYKINNSILNGQDLHFLFSSYELKNTRFNFNPSLSKTGNTSFDLYFDNEQLTINKISKIEIQNIFGDYISFELDYFKTQPDQQEPTKTTRIIKNNDLFSQFDEKNCLTKIII